MPSVFGEQLLQLLFDVDSYFIIDDVAPGARVSFSTFDESEKVLRSHTLTHLPSKPVHVDELALIGCEQHFSCLDVIAREMLANVALECAYVTIFLLLILWPSRQFIVILEHHAHRLDISNLVEVLDVGDDGCASDWTLPLGSRGVHVHGTLT